MKFTELLNQMKLNLKKKNMERSECEIVENPGKGFPQFRHSKHHHHLFMEIKN